MTEKCTKYEALFVFGDEKALLEHIQNCPDCKREHEKMQAVSSLVKEAAPFLKARERRAKKQAIMAIAASVTVTFLAFFTIQVMNPESFIGETTANIMGSDVTYEQMGLPVDDYGFIMVDYDEDLE